jgi:hypothetical protein
MTSSESSPFSTAGDLADAIAALAADGLFAQPFPITGAGGAQAVVISTELLEILQRALNDVADEAPPLSPRDLAESLGLELAADGTLGVRGG